MAGRTQNQVMPQAMQWPKSLYYQMAEMGWFEGKRVELIKGEIVVMAPMGTRHLAGIIMVSRAFYTIFGDEYAILSPGQLELGADSIPEPDIAVVKADIQEIADEYPSKADLVVEVSDTSLKYDRGTKSAIYAAAGIPEYWIISLAKNVVEVRRNPIRSESVYSDIRVLGSGEHISPLVMPSASIAVDKLLPPGKRRKQSIS